MEERNIKTPSKKKKVKKSHFSLMWKILTVAISLLIVYTCYHVFFGLAESLPTTAAGLVEQRSSVMFEGVIFRNEETISTKYQGDMRPYFSNGERVSTDCAVAAVYSQYSGDDINSKIEEIKEKIDILERSNVKGLTSIADIERQNAEIDRLYTARMLAISNNENYKVKAIEKELAIALNKMKIYSGEVKSFTAEIESLKAELEVLYNSFKGEKEYIFADKGGYFYHSCDGYENSLTYESLSTLGVNDLKSLLNQTKHNPKINSVYTCKFVYESTWRLASVCDEATASTLEVGKQYSITLFDVKERQLNVTLESIGESQEGECLIVFSCATMPEGFDYTRYQSFRLDISAISGYRVPKEALVTVVDDETEEKKIGVYIIQGSVAYFRRVEVIAEDNGYYIAAKLDKSKENYKEYLNINDLIILEPDGLYDGKMLSK